MQNVEDIYPLSPLQEGILFHILLGPGSGAYVVHLKFTIDGDFNTVAFKRAWHKILERHPVLRSSFVWEKVRKPLQIVRQQVTLAWDERDWREFTEEKQVLLLDEYVQAEHRRGFDPAHAPLMRMGLMRLGEDRFQFTWNYSHLLLDGWSANIVLADLSVCYRAYCDGREVELPRPVPYRSFISWLQQQDKSEAENFWRKTLNGFDLPTRLGAEDLKKFSLGDERVTEYPEISGKLDPKTTLELQSIARQHRLTLNTFFAAAWAWLLGFYAAVTDVVFGVTVAGRPALLPGMDSMVGVLANTIPLRVTMTGQQEIVDWLKDIQNHQVEMSSYEYSSLVEIKSWSEVPGALPLFESFLVFENHPVAAKAQELHGNVRFASGRAFGSATYPLGLRIEPGEEFLLRIIYDQRRFSAGAIDTLLDQVRKLLADMVNPTQKVHGLSLLTAKERQQIVYEWNQTARPYGVTPLQTLLEQQVERSPGAIAVEDYGGQLTYAELNQQANRLAHYLRYLKVGPEVRVGICLRPSLKMITAVLSVLKAGGTYVPLSPDDPPKRLQHIMSDSRLAVLLTEQNLRSVLSEFRGEVIELDSDWHVAGVNDDRNPELITESENAAYVIYTSGSTGAPKGVVVQHGSLLNYLLWVRESLLGDGIDCVPAITSLGFDASIKQILGPLLMGSTVSILADFAANPEKSFTHLSSRGRIALNCVPSVWQKALEEIEENPSLIPVNLAQLWLGGESCSRDLIERSIQALPSLKISNLYGPTEATANAVYAERISPERLYIGRPIANAQAFVLDLNLQPVPIGTVGELFIGGSGVARGYQNHPALTAEKFIPNPFGSIPGERLYGTGDRARWRDDGNLEFIGRTDQQVKIRGNRIELGEIEAVLCSHPLVEQAAVLAREDGSQGTYLAAYAAPKAQEQITVAGLRLYLQESLPKYMLPRTLILLPSLPVTSSGKLDRQSLPETNHSNGVHRLPRTPQEEVLCEVIAEVLGLEHVNPEDNFFDLGGHSLIAMRLIGRIRAVLGMDLRLADIFSASTLAEMAMQFTHAADAPPLLKTEQRPAHLPLSYAQQRLWFIDQLEGASTQYNLTAALRLSGPLDESALVRAINAIIERHEILRTCFRLAPDGEPEQIVLPRLLINVPIESLVGLDDEGQKSRISELLAQERDEKFDLVHGPLLRVKLLRMAADEHILVRSIHHIVYDGWSTSVFNREFTILYEAFQNGEREHPLPPLAIQYADFALWQRSSFDAGMLEQQLSFWKENLAGIPEQLGLPVDRPRGARQTFGAELCQINLADEQIAALKRLARANNATLYMVLLSALAVLLKRYSGQPDVVIGSPIANRPDPQLEESIGFFVNSLVMRVRVDEEAVFLKLLEAIRGMVLNVYRHKDLPFDRLVEEIAPQRAMNVTPIFQVVFAFQNTPESPLQMSELKIGQVNNHELRVRHDLEVHAWEQAGHLEISWLYNRDLFDRWRMEQMAHHYQRLLETIICSPEVPLYRAEMMDSEERQLLFAKLDATEKSFLETTVPRLFEQQVAMQPDTEAVICGEQRLSYAELNSRADSLAAALRSCGVTHETLVGVILERSSEIIVAVLGILKAGGAYVPIAPEYPLLRKKEMIADARLRHVVTVSKNRSEYAGMVEHVIPVDIAGLLSQGHDRDHIATTHSSNMAAYVNYTSGSTGKPKGVLVSHASIVRLVRGPNYVKLDSASRLLQLAPLSFDAATFEIWGALLNGGCVVVMPEGPASAHEIGAVLAWQRVNTLWLTAGLFHEVVESDVNVLSGVRQLLVGGDIVSPDHVKRLLRTHPQCQVINGYGPTENTTFSCCFPVKTTDELSVGVPIGFPIRHTRVYVLDDKLQPVPTGVAGELYVAGIGLARGYLNQSSLTADRFIADPYAAIAGLRMYRTGDLVRCNHAGALEFLGRADRQLKVRGFRVEPQEIETALCDVEGVSQSAVLAWQDGAESKQLVAYVVPTAGTVLNAASISHELRMRLPAHLVPSDFIFLNTLQLNANGKLDRAALPRPQSPVSLNFYRAPRTATEEMLCEMFAAVLEVERVSTDDNFFEMGGHSLLATRLVSRIRTMLGKELPLRAIFEFPSVGALAAQLSQPIAPRLPLIPQARPERLPLSYAQQRLWFIDQMGKSSVQYHIPTVLRLRGALNYAALQHAINAVVQRHESLRTTFVEVEGHAAQVVAAELRIEVPLSNLSGHDDRSRQQIVQSALRQEREQPFDLSRGPLLRAKLLMLAETEHILLLTFHHIITDGWSLGIFNQEFIAFYEAFEADPNNEQALFAQLSVQYPDFAIWQRAWLDQKELASKLEYWKQQLAGIPEQLVLPQDRPRQARQTFAAGVCSKTLPAVDLAKLKRLTQSGNATLYMSLLSALAVLLQRYSQQKDIVVGSPIANRQEPQLEEMIGFFVNSLVMRVVVDPEETFQKLLARVRGVALSAYQNQDLPFEKLVEELAPRRSLNTPPIFQVMFALQNAPISSHRLKTLEVTPMVANELRVRLDLELHARESSGQLEFYWVYNSDLFDHWRIDQMARHYKRLLELIAEGIEQPLWQMDVLTHEERSQILAEWNHTALDVPPQTLHELFERQAAKTPNAVAAIHGEELVTYSLLNQRANQLAHYLRKQGAGPEVRVGICTSRKVELIVGLLGILKTGAAYVALDVNYPAERVAYMLSDSAAPLLIIEKQFATKFAAYKGILAVLDGSWDEICRESTENPGRTASPENLAYVIYTSGSTGTPKGVAIRHSSAALLLQWSRQTFSAEDLACVLASTSICFDLSIFEIFAPLSWGGSVLVVDNVLHLGSKTGNSRVTLINTVPSAMKELVRSNAVPASVRTVNLAGEVLSGDLVYQIFETTNAQTVFNLYGPSEDTTYSTAALLARGAMKQAVPIGKPVANTQAYVLDEWMSPVPIGVAGDLYLSGDGLARGYLNRGDLTAGRFIPNPFSVRPGERMYRTGDSARYLQDGELEFLGRADQQVKLRGFRIELGEIENALIRSPEVSEAAVIMREDKPGDKRLVAYIIPAPGKPIDAEALRRQLQQTLPDFMIPAEIVSLETFPNTPNGKLDKKALPAPDLRTEKRQHEPPRTELEQAITRVWREVLEIETIGVHDNFFDVGGHSILAKLLQAKLYNALGQEIELVDLFQYPTIASLARFLEGKSLLPEKALGEAQRAVQQKMASEKLRRARGI
ncbi:MAG: amino acid adenylation domain-containing protein [Candidatus Angelobacter sp.]